jgi:putative membrane protein
MPSEERRLHPASVLFALGSLLRGFAIPGVLVLFTAGSRGWDWQVWVMWLAIPYFFAAVARYLSFRYRYEPGELVIRSGLLFKNERHVPYARIQNLDAVQNPVHRLLGVVEVRVETGGGEEPEAKMSVLPLLDFEEMRRRVFAGRGGEAAAGAASAVVAASATPPASRPLLALPARELALAGLIENRGFVVIAAAFGLLWELGLLDRAMDRVFGDDASGRGVVLAVVRAARGAGGLPVRQIVLFLAAFAGFLLLVRLLSMAWTLVRLHGFRLTREGDDLRREFGLVTRVKATVPLHRVQTLTIREGPLHRLFRRTAVRVETAGGGGEDSEARQREWLAPIVRREALPGLLAEVLPELDLATVAWQPPHPRALRREFTGGVLVAGAATLPFVLLLAWWTPALLALLLAWAYAAARLAVAHTGWAAIETGSAGAVAFRSGSFRRRTTVVRYAKIQAVEMVASPFDRRHAMARVRVDTAGAGDLSHRVDIPYLAEDTARDLYRRLAAQAARTEFRW